MASDDDDNLGPTGGGRPRRGQLGSGRARETVQRAVPEKPGNGRPVRVNIPPPAHVAAAAVLAAGAPPRNQDPDPPALPQHVDPPAPAPPARPVANGAGAPSDDFPDSLLMDVTVTRRTGYFLKVNGVLSNLPGWNSSGVIFQRTIIYESVCVSDLGFLFQTTLRAQVYCLAELGVDYSSSAHGIHITRNFLRAAKKDRADRFGDPEWVDRVLKEHQGDVALVIFRTSILMGSYCCMYSYKSIFLFFQARAKFGSQLTNYAGKAHAEVAGLMNTIFCTPRGHQSIKSEIRAKMDSVHEMLGLKKGEALIRGDHPLCLEYQAKSPDKETPELFFALQSEQQILVSSAKFSEFPATQDFVAMLGTLPNTD